MTLEQLRQKIDFLDQQIVDLLDQRSATALEIVKAKQKNHLVVKNQEREQAVLDHVASLVKVMPSFQIKNIYQEIMRNSVILQEQALSVCSSPSAKTKLDVSATILENRRISDKYYSMRLLVPDLADKFRPGQFFQLSFEPATNFTLLRRPFAPSFYHDDGFSFVYAVVGKATKQISTFESGKKLKILAPLGNTYTIPKFLKTAVLVGGGYGTPSLLELAKKLHQRGCTVITIIGAKSHSELLFQDELNEFSDILIVTTNDGSRGLKGFTTEALKDIIFNHKVDMIYSCGPKNMLKSLSFISKENNIPCEVSLEERMACGFGACMGCVVKLNISNEEKYYRVCHDGPIFNSQDIVWD